MAIQTRLVVIGILLSWTTREVFGRYGVYQRYYSPKYGRNLLSTYRKYYSPLSYCIKMVYGKDIYLNLPYSYLSPIKNLEASNAQDEIKKTYGNMFMTLNELKRSLGIATSKFINWKDGVHPPNQTTTSGASRGSTDSGPFQINSDVCCSTNEVFFINDTLKDVENVPRKIAQLSKIGAYQFIRHGFCHFKGACQGSCVQHFINLPLAVDEPGTGLPISFRFFKIPGYCSCRFVGF